MAWWHKLTNKQRGVFGSAATTPQPLGDCDHGEIHLRQGTAEFEWFVARGELESKGDLQHGASHLANLLSYDPGDSEWIELLERYLAAAGRNPEKLIPRGEKLYYSTEAMRAYIWHKQGRLHEALDHLAQVTQAKNDARYLEAWAIPWLEPKGAVEGLPENIALHLFSLVLSRFPEARLSPLVRLNEVRRWARLCERYAQGGSSEGMLTMLRGGILRKAGYFDQARTVVQASLKRHPDWHAAVALGLILREQGDSEQAEKAFRYALKLDPEDITAMLEAGDMFLEKEEWDQARAWYESVLTREKKHIWALPSSIYCRWKTTDDQRVLEALFDLAKGGNDRARGLCHREFWNHLPEPCDASANMLRQFRDNILSDPENAPSGLAHLTLSGLESPSNFLAFRLEMEALKHDLKVEVEVTHVARPDPRLPIEEIRYMLWRYKGTNAAPALPPPGKDVLERIAQLAASRLDDLGNWADASRVAAEIGPERVGEVLATMVHPPAVPPGHHALQWLPRVQHAAAQVAAQIDDGWEGSVRREALLSVLFGPQDWATEAAIRALARLGREHEAIAPDIHDAFQLLFDHRPDSGFCCWERTLFSSWLELPHLYDQEREEMESILRAMDEQAEEPEE